MRITHVIIGLGDGGAERSLFKLVTADDSNIHSVISLTSEGKYGPLLSERGISVVPIQWRTWNPIHSLLQVMRTIRKMKPEIIQGWMPHAALVASLVKNWAGARRVVWSMRSSDYGTGNGTLLTRGIVAILARLSHRVPSRIIVVGHRALQNHADAGFNREKLVCIQNGYLPRSPKASSQAKTRIEPGLPALNRGVTNFGMVARYHPKKGHNLLLAAFARLDKSRFDWTLRLVGEGLTEKNHELVAEISRLDLTDRVVLLGPVADPEEIYKVLDFHVLPSLFGEGFPNVVAESMLAGVPNIVADAGDSALIVGDTGWIVPVADLDALEKALEEAVLSAPSERRKRGARALERISQQFSLQRMVQSHVTEYNRKQVVAYPRYSRLGASSRVRMFQFEGALASEGWHVTFFPFSNDRFLQSRYLGRRAWLNIILSFWRRILDLGRSRDADLVWIQRELIPWAPAWVERLLTPRGSPVVYDFDDAVHEQFRESPRAIIRAMLGNKTVRTVGKSAGVVVGNQTLADFFTAETKKPTALIPSAIDRAKLYPGARPSSDERHPFIFGWIGTPLTYETYVLEMLSDFERLAKKLGGEFWVIGAGYAEQSTAHVKYFPWSEATEHQILQSLDVGVMPLRDDPWSRGKCGYKLLQYMAVGKPVVATPVGVNIDIVNHGENGFLVNKVGDWERYLGVLAEDRVLAYTMGQEAVRSVDLNYSLTLNAPKLARFFRDSVDE